MLTRVSLKGVDARRFNVQDQVRRAWTFSGDIPSIFSRSDRRRPRRAVSIPFHTAPFIMKPSDLTSWSVIEQAASGIPEAREDFVRRYEPVVRAYFGSRWRSSSRPEDVDDVSQEVFLECFRDGGVLARAQRDRPGGFRAFLYGVVRNVALRFERRRARSRERQAGPQFDFDGVGRDEATLSRVFDRSWARLMVREAFQAQKREAETSGPRALRRVERV